MGRFSPLPMDTCLTRWALVSDVRADGASGGDLTSPLQANREDVRSCQGLTERISLKEKSMSWEYSKYEAYCEACGREGVCVEGSDDWGRSLMPWRGFGNR